MKKKLCKKFGVLEKSITFAPALRDRVGFKEADGSFERRKKSSKNILKKVCGNKKKVLSLHPQNKIEKVH